MLQKVFKTFIPQICIVVIKCFRPSSQLGEDLKEFGSQETNQGDFQNQHGLGSQKKFLIFNVGAFKADLSCYTLGCQVFFETPFKCKYKDFAVFLQMLIEPNNQEMHNSA